MKPALTAIQLVLTVMLLVVVPLIWGKQSGLKDGLAIAIFAVMLWRVMVGDLGSAGRNGLTTAIRRWWPPMRHPQEKKN
ncbi:MAG: hypothetical protein ABI162_12005 [Luteolibacter sp.]